MGKRKLTEPKGYWLGSESAFKQLYYQNPEFGYYIVQLIGRRLSSDIERLAKAGASGGPAASPA